MVKTYCSFCSKKCVGDVLRVGEKFFHQNCFKCTDCNSYLDTGGFYFRDGVYYCPLDYTKRFTNKCYICSNVIESEIVSALNKHFHRNCFKCNICSKIFSPGDRVTMKNELFLCIDCFSDPDIDSESSKPKDFGDNKTCDVSINKELFSEDVITDQGYISADPTSLSFPTPNDEANNEIEKSQEKSDQRSKSRSSLCRSLFEFGKFYKNSYLDIQESRRRERQSQARKSSSSISTSQVSNKLSLAFTKNRHLKINNIDASPKRSGISSVINSSSRKLISASESDVSEKENVIRLSSYPAGEKHPDNLPFPLERDDWPSPLSTDVLMREKLIRKRNFFGSPTEFRNDTVDYTQSLNHLVPDSSEKQQQRNLSEILSGNTKYNSNRKFEDNVISASRSPNASMEPTSKPRYIDHKDKSKSRDSAYFNDVERHIGYSLEFVSSTTRPFMAGRVPYEIYGGKMDKHPCNSCSRPLPGYTEGLLHEMRSRLSRESRVLNTNNSNKRGNEASYTWTAVRTLSDNFDVQLKNIEYESTTEETLFDNQDELSCSEIDLVTGLKVTRNRSWKDRNKEQNATSDKSSINSKIESLETWSFWSQKPLSGAKSSTISYYDILSKDPKIMKGLDINRLETYLPTEDFQDLFNLNRTDFYRLPEWKQNDLKRRVHLF